MMVSPFGMNDFAGMFPRENLIFVKGQNRTANIVAIARKGNKVWVEFGAYGNSPSRSYTYRADNIRWFKKPAVYDPASKVLKPTKKYFNKHSFWPKEAFSYLCHFSDDVIRESESDSKAGYWYAETESGLWFVFDESEVVAVDNLLLTDRKVTDVFEYLRTSAGASKLKNENGQLLLQGQYADIVCIPDTAIAKEYLSPAEYRDIRAQVGTVLYPFGLNESQCTAIRNALASRASVIQGPPGTGKTQTILNILANLVWQGKTALVVSNNNSATKNVADKLADCQLDFLVAALGNADNRKAFLDNQGYIGLPDGFSGWRLDSAYAAGLENELSVLSANLDRIFRLEREEVQTKTALSELLLEASYFRKDCRRPDVPFEIRWKLFDQEKQLDRLIRLWKSKKVRENLQSASSGLSGFLWKIKCLWTFRSPGFHHLPDHEQELLLQHAIYDLKENVLREKIRTIRAELDSIHSDTAMSADGIMKRIQSVSMLLLKDRLFRKYHKKSRLRFDSFTMRSDWRAFLEWYPIVLSSAFSSRCLGQDVEYDYVIMDEASQVSVETGFLALTSAKNAVIVGDQMQLRNVVTDKDHIELDDIYRKFSVPYGYHCAAQNFLSSILAVLPKIPQTILREHYRCVPAIIDFCNKQFYDGQLLIMTEPIDGMVPLEIFRTVAGQHTLGRSHVNLREIKEIQSRILPSISGTDSIGIISPFRNQIDALRDVLQHDYPDVEIDTVHKFQGREKDAIILTLAESRISSFADSPDLLNVAVSRAKKKLCIVITGNEIPENTHISNLLEYINYQGGPEHNGSVVSIFDFLYHQYTDIRKEFLARHTRVSEYDSENLLYGLLEDIWQEFPAFGDLQISMHIPLNRLIRRHDKLDAEESEFVRNPLSHLDFLIWKKLTHKPVLAIEVDGYRFHHSDMSQRQRDELKNRIFRKCSIPLLRLSTKGDNEKARIIAALRSDKGK